MSRGLVLILTVCSMMAAAIGFCSEDEKSYATFAGGCFWCMEEAFEKVEGVKSVTSGFMSGIEAVDVVYDKRKVDYEKLMDVFWKNIDPTDSDGQFCDRGPQYRSAIFYRDDQQKTAAEQSIPQVQQRLGKPVATAVMPAAKFTAAGEEHQDYYRRNAIAYKRYKTGCGREQRLQEIWK